ncbi:SH3 domain-containing protein [Roseburia sp. 831b]|uniref:SH3 domain-containing protein n=1 Tax=Roseburia sp. 831b TaxID=1261635 RepID=UPI000B1EF02D|nr:SH3 domain-containing protein [Roseburia sp. 831b]WVK74325.1 SH3 domain-containing protein [Roseburia sp. 831b]
MDFSKVKDFLKKETFQKMIDFCKKNIRYITAGVLFVVLVIVLAQCTNPKDKKDAQNVIETEQTEVSDTTAQEYEVDANPAINELINNYYTAYANGDIATLSTLASPISANEQSYIGVFSQYVEGYQNISCYTKKGADDTSYLVSVYMEMKFVGVDILAPGLDFFYVRTNPDGSLYIDNLYSQYNYTNQENALDANIQSLITQFEQEDDVVALQQDVQAKYESALAADPNLSNMISTTLKDAIASWVTSVTSQSTETTETETPQEETPQEETPQEETPQEETPQEPQVTTETVYTTSKVNVRSAADENSDKLGTAEGGTSFTRTGTDGDWSIIDYNGSTGYIKSEFLTTDAPAQSTDAGTAAGDIAEGTVITLTASTNIRSSMSETADKVGVAFAGEKVTVVMSYAEGWTKVTWNGKEGYVKTELLQ